MAIYESRFLERIWYCANSSMVRNKKRFHKQGQIVYESKHIVESYKLPQFFDWYIPRSHVQIGICIGVSKKTYTIIREWSIYKSEPGKMLEVPESDIIVGIPVDMSELLTHDFDIVRKFARQRIEIKGAETFV